MNIDTWKKTLKKLWETKRSSMCAVAVVIVIALGCAGYAIHYYHGLHENEGQFDALRQMAEDGTEVEVEAETETETEEDTGVTAERLYDFDELRETSNSDIYAWITVPGTDVDYPILQCETDNYYLDHNLDHSSGYPGCIYTNQVNAKDFSDLLTVLYGHDMRSTGTMFNSLHSFEDASFFSLNQDIIVYTENERLTYTICAASRFSDVYIPSYYEVTVPEARGAFMEHLLAMADGDSISHTRRISEEYDGEPLIILSTCIKNEDESRYLIVGVLTETAPYLETAGVK